MKQAMSHQEKLAEEHWRWLQEFMHPIYVDAMIHGYKHGFEDAYKQVAEEKFENGE